MFRRLIAIHLSSTVSLSCVAAALLWLSSLAPARAATLTVGGTGTYSTIGAALSAASAGDTIRVAAGTYLENVLITKTVTLEGGWNADFTARDPAANVTTIRPANPAVGVVTIQGQLGNTAAVAPTLDGFTLTGGRSVGHGGGIAMLDSNALIRNNVITDNVGYLFGGGVWVQRGAPTIENNRVENNRIDDEGGIGAGIELEGTQATLIANIIAGNVISSPNGYGGGLGIEGGGPVTLTANSILSNTATIGGTGLESAYGGGVSARTVTVTVSANLVQGNTAGESEYGYGGGLYVYSSTATISGNTVQSNTASVQYAGYGGGLYLLFSAATLSDNLFEANTASVESNGYGGGLRVEASTAMLSRDVVRDNAAGQSAGSASYGGGLIGAYSYLTLDATRFLGNDAGPGVGSEGGGLWLFQSPYTLTNALVAANTAPTTGGVSIYDGDSRGLIVNTTIAANSGQGIDSTGPLTLTNSILLSHTIGVSITPGTPVSITFNDFYANANNSSGFILDSTNLLVNPALDSDYHLTAGSPLLDAGARVSTLPPHDLDGESRFMAGPSGLYRVDIGADEFTGAAQRVIDLDAEPADLTVIGPGNPPENPNSIGPNDFIGYSVLGEDVNGDGRPDLVTAAEDWADDFDNPPHATGRSFGLFNFGTRLTGTVDLLTDTADLTVVGRYLLQHIGSDLVGGDLNADGLGDLILGSFEDDNAGNGMVTPTVFALWGGPSLAGTRILTDTSPADFMLRAPGQDFFAFSAKNALATADLNGDGTADLIVGDAVADHGATADTGAIFVIFGGSGLAGLRDLALTPADYTLYGAAAADGLGYAALGRVDAGSQSDLVARTDTTAYVMFGPITGSPASTTTASADTTITGLQLGGVIVMDLTGDGQDDMLLGSNDRLYVVPGPLAAGESFDVTSRAVLTITGALADSLDVSDVAGDARPDLLVGSPFAKRAYVVAGGQTVTGTFPITDLAVTVVQGSHSKLGKDFAAGDLDFDGRPDLIVGTFGVGVTDHPMYFDDAGKVFVLYSEPLPGVVPRMLYLPLVMRNWEM